MQNHLLKALNRTPYNSSRNLDLGKQCRGQNFRFHLYNPQKHPLKWLQSKIQDVVIISSRPPFDDSQRNVDSRDKFSGFGTRLPPPPLPPLCNIRGGMSGQVLRVKWYYDVIIHKYHCEDVYDLIDLRVGRADLKDLASKWAT